jgi:enoyl-[acyl-carrier protein] reductase III
VKDLFSLQGRRALVTGGTRGIGRAITLRFAAAGASVIANYVRDDQAAETLRQLAERDGLAIETCRADISSEKGLDRIMETLDAQSQKLSIVVHCAASGVHRPLEQLTARHFDWTYALNVRAFMELVRRVLPRLDATSNILALSSAGATRAVPQYALVGSSKAALEALVRHFAVELAPRGVRMNTLSAGAVLTDAWNALPDRDVRLADATKRSPLGHLNSLDEIACAAQFLCSAAACGIVGQTVVVDGGRSIVE